MYWNHSFNNGKKWLLKYSYFIQLKIFMGRSLPMPALTNHSLDEMSLKQKPVTSSSGRKWSCIKRVRSVDRCCSPTPVIWPSSFISRSSAANERPGARSTLPITLSPWHTWSWRLTSCCRNARRWLHSVKDFTLFSRLFSHHALSKEIAHLQ